MRRGGRSKGEGLTGGGEGAGPPTFEDVVKAEWSFVVDIAQSCGVPEAQCEDVAIEVFLRLERHFESMSSSEPPVIRAWLRTTTVHMAQEQPYVRAMSSSRALAARPSGPADPDLMDPAAIVPTPEDQLMAAQTQGTLRSLVETLEPNRRDVFVAHVIEEDPMHEVARRLGIPEATAYNRLRLAREDLRETLLRAWRADERKPGGRSFAVMPLILGSPPEVLKRLPREMWQSLPRDVWQSLPKDVWQSFPRDVHRSLSMAAQSAVEALSHCVSAAALAGGAALVTGAALGPGELVVDVADVAEPAGAVVPPVVEVRELERDPVEVAEVDRAQQVSQEGAPRTMIQPAPRGEPPARDVRPSLPRDVRPSLSRSDARWRPQLLLSLAASALHRGDLGEAAAVLRLYRTEYPDDPLADVHREVRSQLLSRAR